VSYSIHEGLVDAEGVLRRLRQIAERYPDATEGTLPGGERVYVSGKVRPNAVAVSIRDGEAWLCPYDSHDGTRTFCDHWEHVRLEQVLRCGGDDFARALLKAVRGAR
jgi:hypothetical protein